MSLSWQWEAGTLSFFFLSLCFFFFLVINPNILNPGQLLMLTVPAGVMPGQTFQVQVQAPQPQPQAVVSVVASPTPIAVAASPMAVTVQASPVAVNASPVPMKAMGDEDATPVSFPPIQTGTHTEYSPLTQDMQR